MAMRIRFAISTLIGRILRLVNLRLLILWAADSAGIDLLQLAYSQMGILKHHSIRASGEEYLISHILPSVVTSSHPLFMDIGAHKGEYSQILRRHFHNAEIHACEPHPTTYSILKLNTHRDNIHTHNIGLGAQSAAAKVYSYANKPTSSHASLYREALTVLRDCPHVVEQPVTLITLDAFFLKHNIDTADFIKIDTEGHELAVLRGAMALLREQRLGIIQFEFNEMNVLSRVWLKDFYDLLKGYELFRLDSARLIRLGKYTSRNEIFAYQNIVGIPRRLLSRLSSCTIQR